MYTGSVSLPGEGKCASSSSHRYHFPNCRAGLYYKLVAYIIHHTIHAALESVMTRSILCGNVCSALAQYSFSPAHLFARPAQYPQQQFTRLSVCKDWSSYCNSGGSAASLVGNDIIICGGFFWLPVFFIPIFFRCTPLSYMIYVHISKAGMDFTLTSL